MATPQQGDAQVERLTESVSLSGENCRGAIEPATSAIPSCNVQQEWYPAPELTQCSFHDSAATDFPALEFPQDLQLSEYGIFNATCDPPMSFRDRHRFLDGIYNSYSNPDLITAKEIGDVARKVGLLMEEVLSWFEDEKSRRTDLLANAQGQTQKLTQFPPSPETIRAPSEFSSTSSTYDPTFSGTQSQSLDTLLPPRAVLDQKRLMLPTPKRGRPAKTEVKTERDLSSPVAKRKKISVMYPCPDCGNFYARERWAEHINRTHFPEYVWECPKTDRTSGSPCWSMPKHGPFPRLDNFANHLKGEHDCLDPELADLKHACKLEVTKFFHKICGFCEKELRTRDESIKHVKEHFREISSRSNPPADMGLSLWRERCGSEHILQRGVHYRRTEAPNSDPMDKEHDDENEDDDNEESGDGNGPGPGHDGSDLQPNRDGHNHDHDGDGRHAHDNSDNAGCESPDNQKNINNYDFSSSPYQSVPSLYTPDKPPIYLLEFSSLPKQSEKKVQPGQGNKPPIFGSSYPYPPPRRPSLASHMSYHEGDDFSSEQSKEKGRCPFPECRKVFKDLKAHMVTHQNERPEKCPIQTCDYYTKGFARKYDKNRHTLTHYKGTMVCGFCPGSGTPAGKSFNRADVFKRHLTSAHAVEQMPPNSRRKTSSAGNTNFRKTLSDYAPDATGKCSTCSGTFSNAQDFYEHLDDCVLRIVQQEEPSEAINAARLKEVEQDQAVHETLRNNALLTTTTNIYSAGEDEDEEDFDDENDDDFTLRSKSSRKGRGNCDPTNSVQKSQGLTHSKGGVTLNTKGRRKKRKDYPSSWGYPTSQMKMKKRALCAFDGPRRLWKEDMISDTDYEVRMNLRDGKAYVTDLDVQLMRRADTFHNSTKEEKGPWIADDLTEMDLEKLMEVPSNQDRAAHNESFEA